MAFIEASILAGLPKVNYFLLRLVTPSTPPDPLAENFYGCDQGNPVRNNTLAYLLYSSDAVHWTRATWGANTTGLVSNAGIVYPANPWQGYLLNVNFAYDPATNRTYMTRAYSSSGACGAVGILPDRIQVYRVPDGIPGILTGTWELLVDLGCYSGQPYQQTLPFAPDAAQIRHNGLGHVVFNGDGGLTLLIANGCRSCSSSTFGTCDTPGVYEAFIRPPAPQSFYTVAPCRVVDTRNPNGPLGGPALAAGTNRSFTLTSQCGIPPDARTVAANLTAIEPTATGYLTVYPGGSGLPLTSSISYGSGRTRANNAILKLGTFGDAVVYCGQPAGTTHLAIDVTGYFR